jgi:hypothetical protein
MEFLMSIKDFVMNQLFDGYKSKAQKEAEAAALIDDTPRDHIGIRAISRPLEFQNRLVALNNKKARTAENQQRLQQRITSTIKKQVRTPTPPVTRFVRRTEEEDSYTSNSFNLAQSVAFTDSVYSVLQPNVVQPVVSGGSGEYAGAGASGSWDDEPKPERTYSAPEVAVAPEPTYSAPEPTYSAPDPSPSTDSSSSSSDSFSSSSSD